MAKKKDGSFYQAKAQILKDFGISAEVTKELVPSGISYSESHAKSFAEGRGQSLEEFEKELDDKAHGDVTSTAKLLTIEGEPAPENEGAIETQSANVFQAQQKDKRDSKTEASFDLENLARRKKTISKSDTK